ncbi:uncharacterized protein FFUJ_12844 [Fusarium fujikuroi IMI 58289]|uniref:Uncharacterized protein n=1 Tax=Gibberella fujikuroi (strain CBS 195.34 / IMI 58289 / NRRL A-6831) TaxID=1279085 RepID=S0EDD8_GIBF5|nr:uncharacterized protein FFUJ_12844 [Fusarium fujikuroi IMI 58289]KLP06298.1 uncharacterized protein LW94_300 [Fusarium fujikuroi]CCT72946.1 uncharacterized protein FFUJ_12844 [Fusarium fujikuroi IMI 58289]SCO24883.1 uncharacterized protein FFM5_13857 [Fusarium fujikuroi]SCO53944.1 uncharacterized protein FFMR_11560 [Fusarium fujikuroi]
MSRPASLNPYDKIIDSLAGNPTRIQALFEEERNDRNNEAKEKLLGEEFQGVNVDEILVNTLKNPKYQDPRNCLCIWARPSFQVKDIALQCQLMLKRLSPNLWLTPQDCLHMTVIVVALSITPKELVDKTIKFKPCLKKLASIFHGQQIRLVKPKLSFNEGGVALSFVPAADEETQDSRTKTTDYTYLHLRRDIFALCSEKGVDAETQKGATACHITLARFITQEDHSRNGNPSQEAMAFWVTGIEEINEMLAQKYWPHEGSVPPDSGSWVIDGRRSLDIRAGTIWYGGGQSLDLESEP